MNITPQQLSVIHSTGNARVNAVAGSGKTSTLIEYALHHKSSSILYVAFNRNVKAEAKKKFEERGATNVTVETMHSLAFRHVVRHKGYTVESKSMKPTDLVNLLVMQVGKDRNEMFAIAKHVEKLARAFCNSAVNKVDAVPYREGFSDKDTIRFLDKYYAVIVSYTRKLLGKMMQKEIPVSHDFYLKEYQLEKPMLSYDIILFDEAQDASPVMLDIILHQKAVKVVVGDSHQQIYRWRSAVNSLEEVNFPSYSLTRSFRFGTSIATVANNVLAWKVMLSQSMPEKIEGVGSRKEIKTRAVIGRSNMALLMDAIDRLIRKKTIKSLYFEGRFETYTISDEGSSLFDVLNLHNGNRERIRDEVIQSMEDLADLGEFAKTTGDSSLLQLVEIVEEYGDKLPFYFKKLKEAQVEESRKHEADIIYSTVHRCKGLEYDEVTLLDDFIDSNQVDSKGQDEANYDALLEEINILYVAVTRAVVRLYLPLRLKNLQPVSNLPKEFKNRNLRSLGPPTVKREIPLREEPSPAPGRAWNRYEDENLRLLLRLDLPDAEVAKRLKRTKEEVMRRIEVLGNAL